MNIQFNEQCKTPEGRQIILNSYDQMTRYDLRMQWEGLRANGQTTDSTYDEYLQSQLRLRCNDTSQKWYFPVSVAKPLGTCNDVKFGPPLYDIEATVKSVQEIQAYYRNPRSPWAGATPAEREANIQKAVKHLMEGLEVGLKVSYANTRCTVGNTGECVSGTGVKKICEKVYIVAPPFQELVPSSLKGGQHIKEGPVLQSPTLAWFKVGKTGHGTNYGTAIAESAFTEAGAKEKARLETDIVRRVLIKRNLPVDRTPAALEVPKPKPDVAKPEVVKPKPAKLEWRYGRRGGTGFYDIEIINTGGTAATVLFDVEYFDVFFTGSEKWRQKSRFNPTIPAGGSWRDSAHDFHATRWRIKRL